jgi:hypothetical protein
MAKTTSTKSPITTPAAEAPKRRFCCQPTSTFLALQGSIAGDRLEAIRTNSKRWANGTTLTYWFFDGSRGSPNWVGSDADMDVVRWAFTKWKNQGIGLDFREVARPQEAVIRIGFDHTDGSWSYVGRDVLDHPSPDERTMNFGWGLGDAYGHDTALHEIGHTLGLEHEHQNPNSGIVWNRSAVLAAFMGPPNEWEAPMIERNILDKLSPRRITGSQWDPNSVMHYHFDAGLIDEPAIYRTHPLTPAGGLSPLDIAWVRQFYPPQAAALPQLVPHSSQLVAAAYPAQADYRIDPTTTRKYDIRLFGQGDALMLLYEKTADGERYLAGHDDTGKDGNAAFTARLEEGKSYVLRVKVHYVAKSDELSLMMW